jgi:predicted O-methyltransferase YrrM
MLLRMLKKPMTVPWPQDVFGKLHENIHEYGLRHTIERSALWMTERLLASTLHRHARPPLSAFEEAALSMHFSGEELAVTYFYPGVHPENRRVELAAVRMEYEELREEINGRYARLDGAYPTRYAVEEGSSFLLYALVRSLRPGVVLETGVANGHSSFYILSALLANGHGVLNSIDRSAQVGGLLTNRERERWRLHVLKPNDLKRSFLEVLDSLAPLDLFIHDSDHSYSWISFELNAAIKKLAPGAVLASDDCDCCFAFLDVCRQVGVQPAILVESRKIFGLAFPKREAGNVSEITKNQGGRIAERQSA